MREGKKMGVMRRERRKREKNSRLEEEKQRREKIKKSYSHYPNEHNNHTKEIGFSDAFACFPKCNFLVVTLALLQPTKSSLSQEFSFTERAT